MAAGLRITFYVELIPTAKNSLFLFSFAYSSSNSSIATPIESIQASIHSIGLVTCNRFLS